MKTRITAAALAVASFLLPVPLSAQSSAIGFSAAELTFGHLSGESGSLSTLDASADFAITAHHGFQLDVGVVDYGEVWFGNIAAHLYLQPSQQAKYGLFLAYSDANDTEASTIEAGIEGIWSLTPATTLTARAGMGRADPSEMDYIFGSIGLEQAITDQLAITGRLAVVDADEASTALTATTLDLGLRYHLPSAPVSLYVGASHSHISGTISTDETRLALGLTAAIGGPRSARAPAATRQFAPVRPLRPLLERSMVWDFVGQR
ncbi:hypothetical protein [Vannielia litorea]|uniref:hypothetical protein n=1 Tax=Vannielia litorea TaxID=1217970 RepID=UPI001C9674EB|nr:hypothetical protein [Vannielia litorea]MBY6047366.1 hypothetical protein [Vannielia litorea]MBY6074780.1 hypothetical protein [Vannielia litorea]